MAKLKRGNWSTHELERLRSLYPRSSEAAVARLLHRSVSSVQRKARDIFSRPVTRRVWTKGDDSRLREGFGVVGLSGLCLVLGRAPDDVSARIEAMRAGLRSGQAWGRAELASLKRLYGSRSDDDLVVCVSRPVEEIRNAAAALCLSKDKGYLARVRVSPQPMPRWRPPDVALLRALYPTTPNLDLARRFARSVASVANKANQLGLKKESEALREMGRRNVSARYHR